MAKGEFLSERESLILGQEFLTWLWFKSEKSPVFKAGATAFEVHVEQRVQVEGGSGEGKEVAAVSGVASELREARLGLTMGKKVGKALVKLSQDGQDWTVTLRAEDFSLNSLKTPKVETRREPGEDPDAAWLEKLFLLERAVEFLEALYAAFLAVRLKPEPWNAELKDFRRWLAARG